MVFALAANASAQLKIDTAGSAIFGGNIKLESSATAIGAYANVSANNLTNATAIGANATALSSNQVKIGSSTATSIGGAVSWGILSDKRVKKNIQTDVPGLDFINRLQPVTYNLDLDALDGLMNHDEAVKQAEDCG